jgi:uncharacterized protein (DUF305 family)
MRTSRTTSPTQRRTYARAARAALGVSIALTLSACSDGDSTVATAPSAEVVNGISTSHNDADIAFINDMVPHHEGALAMAELAADRAASPKVKELATRIVAAQQPEIDSMQEMAKAWGVTLGQTDGGHSTGGHSSGGSMEMDADVAALEPLTGAAFDKEFLTRMIEHHEGALTMAEKQLADGTNTQAKALAETIISSQRAEIAEMKALLAA